MSLCYSWYQVARAHLDASKRKLGAGVNSELATAAAGCSGSGRDIKVRQLCDVSIKSLKHITFK